jgi:hypothetical protein
MSEDIYLCGFCWEPIWFPYGQKMHLGTGWNCWRKIQDSKDEVDILVDVVGKFSAVTDKKLRKKLVEKACGYYNAWAKRGGKRRFVPFLRNQLKAGRSDVLRDFFRYLTHEPPERAAAAVSAIMKTPEWKRFARATMAPLRGGRG